MMTNMTSLEKSIAMRLIKKRKEALDVSYTEKYLSLYDINNDKKILLEDIQTLKEMIDSDIPEESWMLQELEKLETQLTEKEGLQESWDNILNKNYDEILKILERKYKVACETDNAKEIKETLHLISTLKKHIDNEIGKNIIKGKFDENIILFNKQIDNIARKS